MTTEIKPKTETEKLFQDLSKPDLANLAYVLRHPDTWPKGFVWNFRNCDQCAMGLAHSLWEKSLGNETIGVRESLSHMARGFAMSYSAAKSVFAYGEWIPTKKKITKRWFKPDEVKIIIDFDRVTPEMVADQIDKYLASKKE